MSEVFFYGVISSLTAAVIWKVYFDKNDEKKLREEPDVERYLKYNYVDPAQRAMVPSWEDFPQQKARYQASTTNYLPAVDYYAPGGSKVRVRNDMGNTMSYPVNQ
jgi:hypothetical protein